MHGQKLQIKAHSIYIIPFPEDLTFYDIMWGNIVQPDRPQMTV